MKHIKYPFIFLMIILIAFGVIVLLSIFGAVLNIEGIAETLHYVIFGVALSTMVLMSISMNPSGENGEE